MSQQLTDAIELLGNAYENPPTTKEARAAIITEFDRLEAEAPAEEKGEFADLASGLSHLNLLPSQPPLEPTDP